MSKKEEVAYGFTCIYFIGRIFVLVKGADWFVEGAAGIARKLGIPQLVIGLTIVAMGTSMPEAAVSITAALNNNAGITIGNIVGSNILNILIILGITAVITNVAIQKSTLLYEIPFMIGITALLLVFGLTGSSITFIEGVVFLLLFIAFLVYLLLCQKGEVQEEGEIKDIPVWKCLLFMVIGGVMVVKGSDFAVSGASWIARFFGMSERFIGLTIVAFGTSLPELVTSVAAARKGNAGIAIGNIVGSNIFNILFVIGITSLICNVPFESKFVIDTAIAIFSGALLWLGTYKHKELKKALWNSDVNLLCSVFCVSVCAVKYLPCSQDIKAQYISVDYSRLQQNPVDFSGFQRISSGFRRSFTIFFLKASVKIRYIVKATFNCNLCNRQVSRCKQA